MFQTLRARFRLWARAFQRRVLVGLLALLYWLGFGPVWLVLVLFNRSVLDPARRPEGASGWVQASGYEATEPACTQPS